MDAAAEGGAVVTALNGTVLKQFGATTVECMDTRSCILAISAMQSAGNWVKASLRLLWTQRVVQTTTRTGTSKANRSIGSVG